MVMFPKGNNIAYGQDFGYHKGVPSGIDFKVGSGCGDSVSLTAKGYGGKPYGNGSIFISKKDMERNSRMEKGKMTKEQMAIQFQKSVTMGILQGMQVRLGTFNLEKFANDNGIDGMVKLNEKLNDLAIEFTDTFK